MNGIDSLAIIDLWDSPFGAFDGKLIVVEDLNTLIWKGHADTIDYRNAADAASFNPAHRTGLTNTTKKHIKYDNFPNYLPYKSRAYGTSNSTNYIYASDDNDGAGSSNERFYFRIDFKVPKKQGTNFTKCTITLTFKGNHFYFLDKWDNTSILYVHNENLSAKESIYNFITHQAEWAAGEQSVTDPFDALDEWDAFSADNTWGISSTTDPFTLVLNITDDINFTDEHYFYNKTAYNDQGYDLYDFTLFLPRGVVSSAGRAAGF